MSAGATAGDEGCEQSQRMHRAGRASQWLLRLRERLRDEFDEFACCFESFDGADPVAWIAVGRLATITCDVRDGMVVGQLANDSRVLSEQLLPADDGELPYAKVFSALASLLRAERAVLSAVTSLAALASTRDLRWFGGWKYLPSGTAVSRAVSFTLPKLAVRIDGRGTHILNWGDVPAEVTRRISADVAAASLPRARLSVITDREFPSREDYLAAAGKVLAALSERECQKVVLSRKRILRFSRPLDPIDLYLRLIEQKGQAFQYLMQLGEGDTWIGISPELLLRRHGVGIQTRPLAGSRKRGKSLADDSQERHSLLTSDKDSREHEIAASSIFDRLQSVCEDDSLKVVSGRSIAQLSYIQHLATEMTGRLHPAFDAIDALTCIYPPATILGMPVDRAERLLRTCEPFERSFFTGGLGVISSNGDCDLALCIRSASLRGPELHLYAGSGYVEGSVPDDEWRETDTKMRPFLEVAFNGATGHE